MDEPANKAEGSAQRRAKGDHLGPEERISRLPFHAVETNTQGVTTFLSVVKLDKRKWLRSVFSSSGEEVGLQNQPLGATLGESGGLPVNKVILPESHRPPKIAHTAWSGTICLLF